MRKKISAYVIILSISCCKQIDTKYATTKLWQYDSGYKLGEGDFINFNSAFAVLKHDTIFINKLPRAMISEIKYRDNEMHIQSLTSDSVGVYINTAEFEK